MSLSIWSRQLRSKSIGPHVPSLKSAANLIVAAITFFYIFAAGGWSAFADVYGDAKKLYGEALKIFEIGEKNVGNPSESADRLSDSKKLLETSLGMLEKDNSNDMKIKTLKKEVEAELGNVFFNIFKICYSNNCKNIHEKEDSLLLYLYLSAKNNNKKAFSDLRKHFKRIWTDEVYGIVHVSKDENLNFRSSPELNGETENIVGKKQEGDVVRVLAETRDDWIFVLYEGLPYQDGSLNKNVDPIIAFLFGASKNIKIDDPGKTITSWWKEAQKAAQESRDKLDPVAERGTPARTDMNVTANKKSKPGARPSSRDTRNILESGSGTKSSASEIQNEFRKFQSASKKILNDSTNDIKFWLWILLGVILVIFLVFLGVLFLFFRELEDEVLKKKVDLVPSTKRDLMDALANVREDLRHIGWKTEQLYRIVNESIGEDFNGDRTDRHKPHSDRIPSRGTYDDQTRATYFSSHQAAIKREVILGTRTGRPEDLENEFFEQYRQTVSAKTNFDEFWKTWGICSLEKPENQSGKLVKKHELAVRDAFFWGAELKCEGNPSEWLVLAGTALFGKSGWHKSETTADNMFGGVFKKLPLGNQTQMTKFARASETTSGILTVEELGNIQYPDDSPAFNDRGGD